jgi:K+-transporting ATPase ATPase C chain
VGINSTKDITMRRNLITAVLYTIVTTLIFGVAYPFAVTAASHLLFKDKADGQLIYKNGELIGSKLIGQPFSGDAYFHSRPSAAGNGYDAANSGGSNYAPTNKKLVDRITTDTAAAATDHPGQDVPVDLITTSASGLDPDITPAAAAFQIDRVAKARGMNPTTVSSLVAAHTEGRQLGILGEPRVNVLELNLALDRSTNH